MRLRSCGQGAEFSAWAPKGENLERSLRGRPWRWVPAGARRFRHPAAHGARPAAAPAQGPALPGCHRPKCQSPSCHECPIQAKPVPLGKFNFFSSPKPDSFKGNTNSKGELDLTPQFLSKKLVWGEQRRRSSERDPSFGVHGATPPRPPLAGAEA